MADDQPRPEAPADPFPAFHSNYVAALEMLDNYHRAGGGWFKSALMVAMQITVNARLDGAPGD